MATISNNTIARAIYLSTKDKKGAELSLSENKIVKFLARRRLLSKSKDILLNLNTIINQAEGKVIVKIKSAHKLQDETKKYLTHSLKNRYGAKEIILAESLEEKLLGGMRIEVNDEVIDLSVKNKIEKLQEYLTR